MADLLLQIDEMDLQSLTQDLNNPTLSYDDAMNTPNREEIDAKFERDQARMDARFASLDGKIDTLVAQMAGQVAQMSGHERTISLLAERAVAASERADAAAEKTSGLKQTLWITSLTTILSVLAIAISMYYGMQSANIGLVQTTISAFQAGQATPAAASSSSSASASNPDPAKKP